MKNYIKIAKTLLKTTKKDDFKIDDCAQYFLEEYLEDPLNGDQDVFRKVLEFIANDGFDINGFGLFEIPVEDEVFCFTTLQSEKCFDIHIGLDGEPAAWYGINGEMYKASNIAEAVRKYDNSDLQ